MSSSGFWACGSSKPLTSRDRTAGFFATTRRSKRTISCQGGPTETCATPSQAERVHRVRRAKNTFFLREKLRMIGKHIHSFKHNHAASLSVWHCDFPAKGIGIRDYLGHIRQGNPRHGGSVCFRCPRRGTMRDSVFLPKGACFLGGGAPSDTWARGAPCDSVFLVIPCFL